MGFRKKSKEKKPRVKREGIYNIPNDADILKINTSIENHCKSLDENGRPKPLTENHLKNIIRSAVREKWMYCHNKLAFFEKQLVPDYDPNTRRLFKIQCNICKNWFNKTDIEIDHKIQNVSFIELKDAFEWASSILNAGGDDLQALCVPCHEIKTLADELNCSFERAAIEKIAIEHVKLKTSDAFLLSNNIKPLKKALHREQIVQFLLSKQNNNDCEHNHT